MNENESVKKMKIKKVVDILTWVLFLLSFVPYLLLVKAALFGADVGLFNSYIAYGFEAVYVLLCYFTIIPIFPVCLIYEIIYVLVGFCKFNRVRRMVIIVIPVTIVLLIVAPCTIYSIVSSNKDKNYFNECEEEIWSYLRDNYSGEIIEKGELTLLNRQEGRFWLRLDKALFDNINYITVNIDKDGNITDDFAENFSGANTYNKNIRDKFNEYVDELYKVDANTDLQAYILKIDMKDFSYQGDLREFFTKCDYIVTSVYFNVDKYNQQAIISKIKDFHKNVIPQLPLQDKQNFNYYVIQDDRFYASIHSYDKDVSDNELTLFISGYTYTSEEGTTIPSSNIDVILD